MTDKPLCERIADHLRSLPPHARDRKTARLLQEALSEIELLEIALVTVPPLSHEEEQ